MEELSQTVGRHNHRLIWPLDLDHRVSTKLQRAGTNPLRQTTDPSPTQEVDSCPESSSSLPIRLSSVRVRQTLVCIANRQHSFYGHLDANFTSWPFHFDRTS